MSKVLLSRSVANTIGRGPYDVYHGFGSVTDGVIARQFLINETDIDALANEFIDSSYLTPEDQARFIRIARGLIITAVRIALDSVHDELKKSVELGMKRALENAKKINQQESKA